MGMLMISWKYPSELDKYVINNELHHTHNFIFCVPSDVFCVVSDKISWFETQNSPL
jgi:hypothetical protein